MIRELAYYARTAVGFARLALSKPEPDPLAYITHALRHRESNFLTLVRSEVFDNPANPYHSLFAWAGCSFEDLSVLVQKDGLESALSTLYAKGIFLTHDEFKGKKPVVRGSHFMEVDNTLLANRLVKGVLDVSSSGSRSAGTVTRRSLEFHRHRHAQERVLGASLEVDRRAQVIISASLPSTGGIRRVLYQQRSGFPVEKWFDQTTRFPYRVLTRLFLLEMALLGRPVAFPEYLPHNDFSPVARYIAKRKREGTPVLLRGGVSKAVRICAAALELGLDISGTLVTTGGEALTDAKRAVIESAGCAVGARYTISELGPIGHACRRMKGNCVHICRDSVAVVSRRRIAPLTEIEVESLLFTSLLPWAATVLINVEMDDAGELGPATCGCDLQEMGFTQQVDKIYSYGKLTGYGTSLVGGEILQILERSLPEKFGGIPTDYQLVERESGTQTEYELRVHPRIAISSEDAVRDYFFAEVRRLWSGSLTVSMWRHGEGVKVVRAEPLAGRTGKILALHLLGAPK